MSAPVAVGERPVDAAPSTVSGASAPTLWRRYRVVLLVVVLVLLAAVAIGVARSRATQARLDPRSVDPEGGRALATLLGDRGVRVDRVTDPTALATGLSSTTAVVVPIPGLLDESAARSLGDASQGTVVVVDPPEDVLAAVTADLRSSSIISIRVRSPGCDEAAAVAAGDVLIGGSTYEIEGGTRCYGAGDDTAPMVVGTTRGGARLVVLGTGTMLTNDRLDEDGDAALGLNLLGGDGSANELRWLVPAPGTASDGESAASILPDWVVPAALQLLLAGLLVALWRGRRLGPPVVEPLPVVVRAAEAVEGRSRLYRRAQARDRAAEALRSGALARMVPRLGIDSSGGQPSPAAVAATVASRSGRSDAAVQTVLFGPPPADDAGLVALADSLDSIVRDTLDPEGPHQ
jgi:hypothetical protein